MSTSLERLLQEIPVAPATEARERAVAAARTRVESRPRPRRRARALAAVAAVLALALLTPPGRVASGWVGELVGIGDVGGDATLEHRGFQGKGPAVVLDNGTAPDGSRYEWVAYPCSVDLREEGIGTRFDGFGLALEWPAVKGRESGGFCEEAEGAHSAHALDSHAVQIVPSEFEGVVTPDLVVSGTTSREVARVAVVYREPGGERHALPVDFRRIAPEVRARITANADLGGTFVAFVPGEWAARDEVQSRLDLRALLGTGKLELGPVARRERRLVAAARRRCGTDRACLERRLPPGPVELIAYDAQGRELERRSEQPVVPGPPAPGPSGPATRPNHPEAVGGHVVLLRGRSPDGARYEVFAEKLGERGGRLYGRCLTTWWPDSAAAGGAGFCGPDLPGSTAFGRRHPDRVAAKAYGFLTEVSAGTRQLVLDGFARPHVARVRVVYRDGGEQRDAPVDLRQLDAAEVKRLAATSRFGWWTAFLPRSARDADIEVIAYGAGGEELSRVPYAGP